MFYVAMKILRNEHNAEDAVHKAFLSILENLDKISNVECPKTQSYIVIIVERKAIDIIRTNTKIININFDETIGGIEIPLPCENEVADAMVKLQRDMIMGLKEELELKEVKVFI